MTAQNIPNVSAEAPSPTTTAPPISVAYVCDDLMTGGWTSLVATIKTLGENGVRPVVVCLFGKGSNADFLERNGVRVLNLHLTKLNLPWKLLSLARLLKMERVDICHTQLPISHLVGRAASLLAGVPACAAHVHSILDPSQPYTGLLMRATMRSMAMAICVSHAAAAAFARTFAGFEKPINVIYNGLDIKEFRRRMEMGALRREQLGIGNDEFVAITVANLKWEKGHAHLVEAAALLDDPQVRFVLVGDGPTKDALRSLIKDRNLEQRFLFLGKREDVPALLALADLFVLPSVSEGLGICVLEAFAAGLPVLTTNAHGLAEIAIDGQNAVVVPPGNPAALAEGVKRLKSDPVLRDSLATAGREWVKKFDVSVIAPRYLAAYKKMLE